jgi:uncharacterized membrane protein
MSFKLSLLVMSAFYIFAGINHFLNADFYYPLIPKYLPDPVLLNYVSGFFEIFFGVLLLIPFTRKFAATGIVFLLIAFIPSHIYFITLGGCMSASLCVPLWVAWVRLMPGQLLLILWAWSNK